METKKLKLSQEDRSSMIIGLGVSLRKRDKDSVCRLYTIYRLLFFLKLLSDFLRFKN